MNENVILAKFGINLDDVIADASKFKQALDEARASLNAMRKSDEATTEQIVRQEAVVKSLNEAYRQTSNVLTAVERNNNELITGEERITKVLNTQATSIEALRLQNSELNKLRNTLDINTQADLIQQLNEKIEANTGLIRGNADAVTKQKMDIGNYSDGVRQALYSLDIFGVKVPPALGKAVKATKSMGTSAESLSGALAGTVRTLGALTVASVKFMLTPIGAVISTIAVAFMAVTTAMSRNEDSVNRLKEAFAPLTRLFGLIMDAIADLGSMYIDKLTEQIEFLEKAVISAFQGIAKALDFLGFDTQAENLRGFTDRMVENIEAGREFERQKQRIVQLERENKIATAELQDELRAQQRIINDTTKSYAEREEAVRKANEIENQNIKNNIELVQIQLQVTREKIRLQGRSTQLLNEEADLIAKIKTLESDITQSDFTAEKKAEDLRKEANDAEIKRRDKLAEDARKRRDEALRAQQQMIADRLKLLNEELEVIQTSAGWRAKTLQEELIDFEKTTEKRLEILNFEFEQGIISRLKYENELAKIDNDRAKRQADISVEVARMELENENERRRRIIEDDRYLSDERMKVIQQAYQERFDAENDFLKKQFENGLINQTEYLEGLRDNQIQFEQESRELALEREENIRQEELDRRALEFEERIELMRLENENEFAIRREILEENHSLELELLQNLYDSQLISQEEYNLRSTQLERQRVDAMKALKEAERDMNINLTNGMLTAISGMVDENSKLGKGIALAMAGINLQQAITKDLALGFPQNIIAVARDTAIGLQAIKKMQAVKIPSASGGGGGSIGNVSMTTSSGYSVNSDSTTARQIEREIGADSENISDAIAEGARRGTQEGMVELTNNRNIQNGASY